MVGGNHLGSMETEGHAGSIPVISVKKRLIFFYVSLRISIHKFDFYERS